MEAMLVLEDGRVFRGRSFGAPGERTGELVFNTSMTGYQEIVTDPSYKGQIVTMTYPLIGNYGVNDEDDESPLPRVEGLVVKEVSKISSNWRAHNRVIDYLKKHNIPGIEGVDTRALTKHIRTQGALKAIISTECLDEAVLIKKAREAPGLIGRDLVREVTCLKPHSLNTVYQGKGKEGYPCPEYSATPQGTFKVIALDCGIKATILRMLEKSGCTVTVMPAHTPAHDILAMKADGLLLSNGPGDPAGVPYVVETVQQLIGEIPIFGICLGHQILGLAFGGKTYKLKFGHRGSNQPVKDLATGKIIITSQNHGFCVDINSLNKDEIEITHLNCNDYTLEGMRHKKHPIFSVQYHPEASPGPHDATYLFEEFIHLMAQYKGK